jgi:hypothetical protein
MKAKILSSEHTVALDEAHKTILFVGRLKKSGLKKKLAQAWENTFFHFLFIKVMFWLIIIWIPQLNIAINFRIAARVSGVLTFF